MLKTMGYFALCLQLCGIDGCAKQLAPFARQLPMIVALSIASVVVVIYVLNCTAGRFERASVNREKRHSLLPE